MIDHKKKLIFINIPKNATTSIIISLNYNEIFIDKPISEYKKKYKNYWNEYNIFSVVRNPIDRFKSSYKFARMNENVWFSSSNSDGLNKHPHYDLCNSVDINGYIKFLYENPQEINLWTRPQTFFLFDKKNELIVNFLVKYENLKDDLEKIGITNIKWLNKSSQCDENLIKFNDQGKKLLNIVYKEDFIHFNYNQPNICYE
jgi:hypothetical protein